MLRRLEIGLVDDGVSVVRAAPEGAMPEPATGLLASIEYSDDPWRLNGLRRATVMIEKLRELPESAHAGRAVEIIHAWGEGCWPMGLKIARRFGADLALEVWSRSALSSMAAVENAARGLEKVGVSGMWLGPDAAMTRALESAARLWPVRCSGWGVHAPASRDEPAARQESGASRVRSIVVLDSGADAGSTAAMLGAFAASSRAAASDDGPVLLFIDERVFATSPGLWKHAESLGLLETISIVPEMEARRELVLAADAFVVTECRGEHRSLVLEALAAGKLLVTRSDRLVSVASDPSMAVVVEDATPKGWGEAMTRLLSNWPSPNPLTLESQRRMRAEFNASGQVARALEAYRALIGAIPLGLSGTSA